MPPPNLVPELPTIEVNGQRRRIVIVETILTDHTPGGETVRMKFTGPDGDAYLFGPLASTYQLIWGLDARLGQLARPSP